MDTQLLHTRTSLLRSCNDVGYFHANGAWHLLKILAGYADPLVAIVNGRPQLPVKPVKF